MTTLPDYAYRPTTTELQSCFDSEIAALGGTIVDVFDDGRRVFARAVLSRRADVRPGDTLEAGVAIRVVDAGVEVVPYTYRLVCSNGAIHARALDARAIDRLHDPMGIVDAYDVHVVLASLIETVRACAEPSIFDGAVDQMREAAETPADVALMMLPLLARLPEHSQYIVRRVQRQFARRADTDASAYALLNAMTSIARVVTDPELRWTLEEAGGAIPAALQRAPRTGLTPSAMSVG